MKHFAAALGRCGIRVNAIAPGVVDTDTSSVTNAHAGRKAALGEGLQRVTRPEEIAAVVAFLASDDSCLIIAESVRAEDGSKL